MARTGLIQGSIEGLRKERAGSIPRHTPPAEVAAREAHDQMSRGTTAGEYVIELDVAAGFLWWWSLFDMIELDGGGTGVMAARSVAPAATAGLPRLSRAAALRAGKRAAHTLSVSSETVASPAQPAANRVVPSFSRRTIRWLFVCLIAAVVAGVFLALNSSHTANPRTEVLRSASPLSNIWVRITGPGGAVGYVGDRFLNGGAFSRFTFRKAPARGLFLPPPVREQKLCGATHVIQPGDAPQLQKWRGRKLAVTIYGTKTSAMYCAVLGYGLYLGS